MEQQGATVAGPAHGHLTPDLEDWVWKKSRWLLSSLGLSEQGRGHILFSNQ